MLNQYLTVTALTKYIKRKIDIDPHLRDVSLKGEISNFNHHQMSGHMYMTIKDEHTSIRAVMFYSDNRSLKFLPENGMNVLIKGYISVFEKSGQYQLYMKEMQPDGVGALFLAFEQLKEKLRKAGFFDEKHKKPIPSYPTHIGIITSPTGAAIRDIISTIKRRYPIVQLSVIPVSVQGEHAAQSICRAIDYANQLDYFDVLILGRGGGSIEDLWCFNDEKVAEAILHSSIPIISGIGHETDTTISDLVADLRAPTPTGAAELAVPDLYELVDTISHLKARLMKLARINLMENMEKLQSIKNSYVFHYPKQLLNEKEQYVDRLSEKLTNQFRTIQTGKQQSFQHLQKRLTLQHPQAKFTLAKSNVMNLQQRLMKNSVVLYKSKEMKLVTMLDKLTLLNPLEIMKRGFTITYTKEGSILKKVEETNKNDQIHVKLLDGTLECRVETIRRDLDE